MQIENVTLGSDVEFFLTDGLNIVSAEGIIEGTKEEPKRFDPNNHWYATQLDNVLAEGNIPPADNLRSFCTSLRTLRNHIDFIVGPHGLRTEARASAVLDEKYMTAHAKVYGCSPSLDAWTEKIVVLHPAEDSRLRAAGFHIHVGYKDPDKLTNMLLARAMDLFLGVPSIIMDKDTARRDTGYGRAGNYRDQPHGMEYRVLSSYMARDMRSCLWAWKQTMRAIGVVQRDHTEMFDNPEHAAIINNSDVGEAQKLVNAHHMDMVLD